MIGMLTIGRVRPAAVMLLLIWAAPAVLAQAPVVTGPGAPQRSVAPASAQSGVDQRMLELLNRINQLETEVRQLRGDVEVLNHELKGVKQRQRELYLDVDRRLRDIEVRGGGGQQGGGTPAQGASGGGAAAQTGAGAQGGQAAAGGSAAQLPPAKQRQQYESAFNLLKEGRYEQSIDAFNKFLKAYPQGGYSDNAQYWLGEANYVSRNFSAAAREFQKVLNDFPESPKVPDAMLKLGFTYYELHKWDEARRTLEQVRKQYPDSTAAQLAETRLRRMRKEGH
jgi:tol-pal system protein YbgF